MKLITVLCVKFLAHNCRQRYSVKNRSLYTVNLVTDSQKTQLSALHLTRMDVKMELGLKIKRLM